MSHHQMRIRPSRLKEYQMRTLQLSTTKKSIWRWIENHVKFVIDSSAMFTFFSCYIHHWDFVIIFLYKYTRVPYKTITQNAVMKKKKILYYMGVRRCAFWVWMALLIRFRFIALAIYTRKKNYGICVEA